MLVPPERPNEIRGLSKDPAGEKVDHFETVRMTKDGRRLDISLSVSAIRNAAGDILGASTIARDITERKRAEETMRQVREAERRRIARDLHDGVLQDLSYTAAAMGLIMLEVRTRAWRESSKELSTPSGVAPRASVRQSTTCASWMKKMGPSAS